MSPRAATTRHRKIGPYRILGELGRGGMARVYRGIHEQLQREAAIKELLPHSMRDQEMQSRFRREALALAAFRHQNIVTLYDLIEKNGSLLMVLEHVDGPTLLELLRQGPLPYDVAAIIADRLAAALEHAHLARVIHRDLKPGNVMLTKGGEVKLMDFGIAKDEGLEALTREGIAIGTPSYMSPEQVMGTPLDGRTDLFSLGVVLYECIVGSKPFVGANAGEVFAKIRDGRYTHISRVDPNVPRPLADVVTRLLEVDPEVRYPDASFVRRDLELFLHRHVTVAHSTIVLALLHKRDHLTQSELAARVVDPEIDIALETMTTGTAERRKTARAWLVAGGAMALVGAGAVAFYRAEHIWRPLLESLLG